MSSISNRARKRNFSFKDAVAGFLGQSGLSFSKALPVEWVALVFAKHGGMTGRIYQTAIVLWAFMGQTLRDGKEASCQSAVSRIASYWQMKANIDVHPNTTDYCRARAKLPEPALRELAQTIAKECEQQVDSKYLFKGRHAKLIDGSTFMMADTPENQAVYPQNPAQKEGIGFPIARFVAVISLATACVIDVAIAAYQGKGTGETALLRSLLDCFEPGDIAVADRYYGNYWTIALLRMRGVDVCFRKHHLRNTDFRTGKRLGKNDHLITWKRPSRPDWMSQELYDTIPESLTLREIRHVMTAKGRKSKPLVVVTSLYDTEGKQQTCCEELAELYGFRWNVELDLRSIKTHMNLHHLRCKSPEMVRREFWTTMIAYNLIRATAASSAALADVHPRQISFVSTCQYVLANWEILAYGLLSKEAQREFCLAFLRQIARCIVGNRPGRVEPRVRKKRPRNSRLMTEPRPVLKGKLAKGDNSFEQHG